MSQNRPIRKNCPALTGFVLFLSFLLSFQTQGSFSSRKSRCLIYKDQKDCTDTNITLMATLYYTTCSGSINECTRVHGRAKPSKATALKSGLQAMGPNTELHCAHAQKTEGLLERKTNTLCYPSRQMLFQGCFRKLGVCLFVTSGACLVTPTGWHLSAEPKDKACSSSEQTSDTGTPNPTTASPLGMWAEQQLRAQHGGALECSATQEERA